MTKRTRRNHSPAFKAKVALATLKGQSTLSELAKQFDVHANQVAQWKEQLLGGALTSKLTSAYSDRMTIGRLDWWLTRTHP